MNNNKINFFKYITINYSISVLLILFFSIIILYNSEYKLIYIILTNLSWFWFLSIWLFNYLIMSIINIILLFFIYLFLYKINFIKTSYSLSFIIFIFFIIMWDLARNITV